MYTLIIFIPALTSFVSGFFSKYLGNRGSSILTTLGIWISLFLSIIAFYEVCLCGSPVYIDFFQWLSSTHLSVVWSLQFDTITCVMLVVVTSVSSLVHLYSMSYMEHDPHVARFFSYLSLFSFFMLVLVTSGNFLQLFLGWEGVGLSSYLLINFWYTRIQANKSAMKAVIVNRIGDFSLLLAIIGIAYLFHSLDFNTVFGLSSFFYNISIQLIGFEFDLLTAISCFLFLGAVGKSAQVGLHTWLPDAMEGPTPVSALIHAATMVTAGVFLLIRSSPILEYAPNSLFYITIVGALTAFFAATTGVAQNDLKRVIAYSTCSQLGYMVFACGLSSYSVSLFHLMNHAFFKALLFLSAGSIIHAMSDEQDMRRMGGLIKIIPFSYIMVLVGSLALMGIPFLTGFYSKDVILELSFAQFSVHSTFSYWLGTISAFFTAFYSMRLIYLTFYGNVNAHKSIIHSTHDAPLKMAVPLLILVIGSIFVGYLFKDMFIGMGTNFWLNSLYVLPENIIILESEFLPYYIKNIPVIFSVIGAVLSIFLYGFLNDVLTEFTKTRVGYFSYKYMNKKWYFDVFYNLYVVKVLLYFSYNIGFKVLDRGFIELVGPTGLTAIVSNLSKRNSVFHSGYIYHYTIVFLSAIVIIVTVVNIQSIFEEIIYNPELFLISLVLSLLLRKL